jgi:hypothetical protein
MPYLELAPPDWNSLLGGSQEAAWIADRNRKFGLAAEVAGRVLEAANVLRERDLLFRCTPEVLREIAFAADWYVSLAGFSMKTLQNIIVGPTNFGLTRQAKGLVERLRKGMDAPDSQLHAFSDWINSEIDTLFPSEREPALALATVFMIQGGRVIGLGQNLGGDDAVDLVKSLLVESFEKRNRQVEVELEAENWADYRPEHNLPQRQRIRFGGRIMCEFVSGGDRPDIIIFVDRVTIAVGEIKGRKDLSNVWESWMPGVYNHMRTWTGQNPDAARLFFGTLINEAMVEGSSSHGTQHVGLKTLYRQGLLTAAYNISKVAENDAQAVQRFEEFADALDVLIRP